jgi:hypothetical protein
MHAYIHTCLHNTLNSDGNKSSEVPIKRCPLVLLSVIALIRMGEWRYSTMWSLSQYNRGLGSNLYAPAALLRGERTFETPTIEVRASKDDGR